MVRPFLEIGGGGTEDHLLHTNPVDRQDHTVVARVLHALGRSNRNHRRYRRNHLNVADQDGTRSVRLSVADANGYLRHRAQVGSRQVRQRNPPLVPAREIRRRKVGMNDERRTTGSILHRHIQRCRIVATLIDANVRHFQRLYSGAVDGDVVKLKGPDLAGLVRSNGQTDEHRIYHGDIDRRLTLLNPIHAIGRHLHREGVTGANQSDPVRRGNPRQGARRI